MYRHLRSARDPAEVARRHVLLEPRHLGGGRKERHCQAKTLAVETVTKAVFQPRRRCKHKAKAVSYHRAV